MYASYDKKDEVAQSRKEGWNDAPDGRAEDLANRNRMTRRILLNLDFRILPILALLFLCSFLDRTNVGNAKLYSLENDIRISDAQYDRGLVVFYVTYIASELPSNLVLKRVSPKIWLPFLTVLWGLITMCLGFVQNYGSFVAVRALLGATEGGLLPGIVLYLSGMYTRGEMALRIGLFYTAASLSGAFGGLLARALSSIGTGGSLAGWRWIFIIEGLFTIIVGFVSYIGLPNTLRSARFLNPAEREYARTRLFDDRPTSFRGVEGEEVEKFSWGEVRAGVFNLQVWLTASAYFAILSGLYSFGLFLPTIIAELGYTADQAQLRSVIPYAVAAVCTVLVALISDRLRLRGTIMLFTLLPAIIGYAAIANLDADKFKVKYGMTILMATGLYSGVPCILVWNSNNSAGHYKRATTSALQLMVANSGGFVASFIYPASDKPNYQRGHTVVLGLLVFAWFMILFNILWCAKINRDKAVGKYEQFKDSGDDRDPEFKMIL